VVLYADRITDSMKKAMDETSRRRKIQTDYNTAHGITPKSIVKPVFNVIEATTAAEDKGTYSIDNINKMKKDDIKEMIARLEKEMKEAAKELQFERAAELRDVIFELKLKHGI
jgi:excinuclease ABC subunit B